MGLPPRLDILEDGAATLVSTNCHNLPYLISNLKEGSKTPRTTSVIRVITTAELSQSNCSAERLKTPTVDE